MIIENITYINLNSRLDKKNSIENQLKVLFNNTNIFRTEGVVLNQIDISHLIIKNPEFLIDNQIALNTHGCYLAHTNAIINLQNLVSKPKQYSLIFEDDVIIDKNFVDVIKNLYPPQKVDIVFFDNLTNQEMKKEYFNVLHPIKKYMPHAYTGAFCYAIKHNRITKILKTLTKNPYLSHVDMRLLYGRLKTFNLNTNTVKVNFNFGSDRLNCKTEKEINTKMNLINTVNRIAKTKH